MRYRKTEIWKSVDWFTILLYTLMVIAGWFSICGATHEIGDTNFFDWEVRTGKQLVWIGCAFTLGFVILMTDDKYYDTLADLFYWGMMVVLLVTPFVAKDIKGSRSWSTWASATCSPPSSPSAPPHWLWPNSSTNTASA